MASKKDIEKRIKATNNTYKITKAMELVSNSKKKSAEVKLNGFNKYFDELSNLTYKLIYKDFKHKFFEKNKNVKTCYLIITTDRGLVGGYNNNIFKTFRNQLDKQKDPYFLAVIGKKGYNYYTSKKCNLINEKPISLKDDILFIDINPLLDSLLEAYLKDELTELKVVYTKYINPIVQTVEISRILPMDDIEVVNESSNYFLERSQKENLELLIPIYLKKKIYGYILNSKLSEHSARITTMTQASKKSIEILDVLNLKYNKLRQQQITSELTDIIAGSNSLEKEE